LLGREVLELVLGLLELISGLGIKRRGEAETQDQCDDFHLMNIMNEEEVWLP
jgi:hypothetical protein